MKPPGRTVIPFARGGGNAGSGRVGRVHRDGSVSFRGATYPTVKDLPADCLALLPDLETFMEWRRLYRTIDPAGGRRFLRPHRVDSGP